jgi:hypothetical protein
MKCVQETRCGVVIVILCIANVMTGAGTLHPLFSSNWSLASFFFPSAVRWLTYAPTTYHHICSSRLGDPLLFLLSFLFWYFPSDISRVLIYIVLEPAVTSCRTGRSCLCWLGHRRRQRSSTLENPIHFDVERGSFCLLVALPILPFFLFKKGTLDGEVDRPSAFFIRGNLKAQ